MSNTYSISPPISQDLYNANHHSPSFEGKRVSSVSFAGTAMSMKSACDVSLWPEHEI